MWTPIQEMLNQSANRIIGGVANFLPGLLALLVALLLSMLLAWLFGMFVRRSLKTLRFDDYIQRWGFGGMADWSPKRSPTLLVARVVGWTIILFGVLVGLSALDANLTSQLSLRAFAYFPNVVMAIAILVFGSLFARFLARGVLISAVNMQIQSARLISVGVKWLIMVLAGAMAFEHLGIGGQIMRLAFAILFGGIVLALALAVGLGSKEIVSRSLERQSTRVQEEAEEQFHHL